MELDRVPIGIFDLNLLAAWPGLDVVPETHPRLFEGIDTACQVVHIENDPVATAGLLPAAIGHRPGARASGTAEQKSQSAEQHTRKHRRRVLLDLEAEYFRVKDKRSID